MSAKPTELISMLYDLAIQCTYREDDRKLLGILSTLIRSLNFDYEIAGSLFNLYEYCQRQTRKKEFAEVRELLETVREAWSEGVVNGERKQRQEQAEKSFAFQG